MNTRKLGDSFEDQVFGYVQRYVAGGVSFLNPRWCQFFQKKRYFSKDRNSEIEVDVSVESYSVDATEWSLLLVIECKNYTHSVPVDDVEEFVAKLDQIAGKNVKGALFSTAGFQKSALEYSKSKGIALVRILPEGQVEWILRRTPSAVPVDRRKEHRDKQIEEALTTVEYVGQSEFLFGCIQDIKSTSLKELLDILVRDVITDVNQKVSVEPIVETSATVSSVPDVPFIGQEELESRTAKMIEFFYKGRLSMNEIDLTRICKYLEEKFKVQFLYKQDMGLDATGRQILGKITRSHLINTF